MNKRIPKIISICILAALLITNVTPLANAGEVTKQNQDFTAYVWDNVKYPNTKTASGISYEIGYCAVHPKSWGSSNWNNPIIPFGTVLSLSEPIPHPDGELWALQVQDTGQLNNESDLTLYWVDVYYGIKSEYEDAAKLFGRKTYTYTYLN